MCTPDGDTYQLSDNLELLKKKFEKEKNNMFCNRLVLAKAKQDVAFGFCSQGDFFAEEIIQEWEENNDE
jgi:hypothetical protein